MNISFKLNKNYAFEFSCFRKIREINDGIVFLEIKFNLDTYKFDHCPRFEILILLINFVLFEMSIYNVNHKD